MSIYQETPSSAFPLPVTAALNEQLGFTCNTVIVDNYTNQYLYFPDIARYVPPSTFGAILPYRPSNSIRATFTPPPGISPAIINTAQSASVTALAAQVPPSPGVSTNTTFNVAQGSVNANITNSTLATTVSSGTVSVTAGTVNATVTNATLDVNATLVHTIINGIVTDLSAMVPGETFLGWGGASLVAFILTLDHAATAPVAFDLGMSDTDPGSPTWVWRGWLSPAQPLAFSMPGGLAIPGKTFIVINNRSATTVTLYYTFYPAN